MRFFYSIFVCAIIVELAYGLTFTNDWTGIVSGVPFEHTWIANTGAVNLTLENGTTTNPNDVHSIASAISSNSYSWTPGTFAVPGQTFFVSIVDKSGVEAFGDKFIFSVLNLIGLTTSSTSASARTTTSKASQTSSTKISQSTSSPSSAAASSGLSSGAKAGIGVGVTLGVCLVVGLAVMAIFWRRRYKAIATDVSAGTAGPKSAGQSEKKGGFFRFGSRKTRREKLSDSTSQVHELEATGTTGEVQELDGGNSVSHELQ